MAQGQGDTGTLIYAKQNSVWHQAKAKLSPHYLLSRTECSTSQGDACLSDA